jgi:sugar (pentulose or hexulose) kinase
MTAAADCLLAIDIGTQSTRAALVADDGTIAACAASPVTLPAPRPDVFGSLPEPTGFPRERAA